MKSLALQNLVKAIFGDEKTKAQFMSDPDSVLARYSLTKDERKAVLTTHFKLGLVTSDSAQLEAALDPAAPWHVPMP